MELKDLIKILRENLILILCLTVLSIALSYIYASQKASGYNVAQTYLINTQEASTSSQLSPPETRNFDSFYQQEKARNFTDTAVAILQSSDFQKDIASPADSLSIQKVALQVIKITSTSNNSQDAQKLNEKTVSTFNEKIKNLLPNQPPQLLSVGPISQSFSTVSQRKIYLLFGAIAGFTLGLFIAGLKTYLKL